MSDVLLILLFGTIAALIGLRLYMVLGRRMDDEPTLQHAPRSPVGMGGDELHDEPEIHFTGPGAAALEALHRADPRFVPEAFLDGAKKAYAFIGEAFARGDRETLEPLLSPRVFERWSQAITEREAAGNTHSFELTAMEGVAIDDAQFDGRTAQIAVEFQAEITSFSTDAKGEVIDGDPDHSRRVNEVWTFERAVDAATPNWELTRVQAG